MLYSYNSDLHKFKDLHDETGGKLKEFEFKYYDCFCGGEQYKIVSTATRHRNHFDVVQCTSCGTLRVNPYLSDASIEKYYKEVYGPVKRKNMTADALYTRQSRSAQELLNTLSPHIAKNAKILDYGSGAGGRMEKFKEAGYDVYLHDHDRKYLDYGVSKGMKEFSKDTKYDVMILSHVLEHINHPVEFLKSVTDLISEKGVIYIEVPLFENTRKLLRDFHLAHKFYFTQESLTHLAAMAGFKKTNDFYNAVLITRGRAEEMPLTAAREKSDKYIARAIRKEGLAKLKAGVSQKFKKKRSA